MDQSILGQQIKSMRDDIDGARRSQFGPLSIIPLATLRFEEDLVSGERPHSNGVIDEGFHAADVHLSRHTSDVSTNRRISIHWVDGKRLHSPGTSIKFVPQSRLAQYVEE